MKIALCLHGLFDSLTDSSSKGSDGYQHIKKNVLNYDIDEQIKKIINKNLDFKSN